jgi:hypothetical protein
VNPFFGIKINQTAFGTKKEKLKSPPHRKKRRTIAKWMKDPRRQRIATYFVLQLNNEFFVHPDVYERLKRDLPEYKPGKSAF